MSPIRPGHLHPGLAVLVASLLLAATPALAEKPDHPSPYRPEKSERHERHERDAKQGEHRAAAPGAARFDTRQRGLVHQHYLEAGRSGHCPPGLAKKGNGCQPPGQARKWSVGRPLPRDLIWHELPPALVLELGPPPELHRYVRVGADILLISIGTGMVLDAIEDLGNLR